MIDVDEGTWSLFFIFFKCRQRRGTWVDLAVSKIYNIFFKILLKKETRRQSHTSTRDINQPFIICLTTIRITVKANRVCGSRIMVQFIIIITLVSLRSQNTVNFININYCEIILSALLDLMLDALILFY